MNRAPQARVILVCYCCWWCLLAPPVGAIMYLYYSSPGDSLGHFSGVWGGPLKPTDLGHADDLRQSGFHCAYMYDGGFYTGLGVKGMFLDPVSKRVIVHLVAALDSRVSLIEGPICTEEPECPSELSNQVRVYMAHGENKDLRPAELGPFAMWNSTVYFVAQRWTPIELETPEVAKEALAEDGVAAGDQRATYLHRLELRRLAGCENQYPFTVHRRADIDKCSQLVARLRQEVTHEHGDDSFNSAFHLHILQYRTAADDDGRDSSDNGGTTDENGGGESDLVFITQIYNWTRSDAGEHVKLGMTLLYATVDGAVHELHHTSLPPSYHHMRLQLVESGGISWRDGKLCWSAVEVIHCATWYGQGKLEDVITVLQPGQAAQVCEDTDIYLNGKNITTGVALADTTGGITLYFGCCGGKPMQGGAGYLSKPDGQAAYIEPLSDRFDVIYAGSMFLTDLCDRIPISTDDKGYNSEPESNMTDPVLVSVGASSRGNKCGVLETLTFTVLQLLPVLLKIH